MVQTNSTIDALADYSGDDYYYDENFLFIIQSYMPLIRNGEVSSVTPTNQQLYKYRGDFYGLLNELGVSKPYHYATLLLNNLRSSADFNTDMSEITIPSTAFIDMIHSTYTTLFNT